jgi:membrane protein DedA with SNARE-associated domain
MTEQLPVIVTLLSVTIGMYVALIIGYKLGYNDGMKAKENE